MSLVDTIKKAIALPGLELEKTKAPQDAQALAGFVFNLYAAESISVQESKARLQESVVRIFEMPQGNSENATLSNGLLITKNGYFITAKHCLENHGHKQVIRYRGNEYPVERRCIQSEKEDLVIAKAAIPGSCEPIIYKVSAQKLLKEKMPVVILTKKRGPLDVVGGYIVSNHNAFPEQKTGRTYYNHAVINIVAKEGHSGSPVVDTEGRLIGIVSARCAAENIPLGTCSKAYRSLELVSILSEHYKHKETVSMQEKMKQWIKKLMY